MRHITMDTNEILSKWKKDFSELLNPQSENEFDAEFYEQVLHEKQRFEFNMEQTNYTENSYLNEEISTEEVVKVIRKLKNKKAAGPDLIPNEVLRTERLNVFLTRLLINVFHLVSPQIYGERPLLSQYLKAQ
jgi:hypothetical protein